MRAAVSAQRLTLTGDRKIAADMQIWIGLSPFARETRMAS
jgi:hypothetical protein